MIRMTDVCKAGEEKSSGSRLFTVSKQTEPINKGRHNNVRVMSNECFLAAVRCLTFSFWLLGSH